MQKALKAGERRGGKEEENALPAPARESTPPNFLLSTLAYSHAVELHINTLAQETTK